MITILDLAIFRGVKVKEGDTVGVSAGDIEDVGLPFMGGCQRCGACIAAYNAAPTSTGFLMCADGCAEGVGYDTVSEANMALFPEEYEWKGIRRETERHSGNG